LTYKTHHDKRIPSEVLKGPRIPEPSTCTRQSLVLGFFFMGYIKLSLISEHISFSLKDKKTDLILSRMSWVILCKNHAKGINAVWPSLNIEKSES